jgi:NTP pyrophosphatase (non-canonical NTP hydrolase)
LTERLTAVTTMDLDDYQRAALRTVNPALSDRDRLLDASAGLAEEAGELLGLVRKRVFQNRPADPTRLTDELGDVLWCLAVVADSLGMSLSEVAVANQAKLSHRHPDGYRDASEWSRAVKE